MTDQLRILTLNVWGLKFISPDRPTRLTAIIDHIHSVCSHPSEPAGSKSSHQLHERGQGQADGQADGQGYDVVCLQELWIYSDFERVREGLRGVLPESKFFRSGALGSGLAIFSRFPIISTHTLPYSLSGLPLQVIQGDFFVNKAAGSCVLLHPELGEVEVWSTHMHASGEGHEVDQSHRMAQAWQLSDHIRASAERGRYVIAAGDFNSSPWSLPVSIMKDYGCLLDSWSESHPVSTLKSDSPTSPEEAIEAFGMTCDSPLNSYSAGKPLTDSAKYWKGKRLDYIFYRGPDIARRRPLVWKHKHRARDGEGAILEEGEPISDSMDDAPSLVCVDSRVVLTGLVPDQTFSYSDHFGLCSTFEIVPARSDVDQAVEGDEPKNRPLPSQSEGGTNDTAEPLVTLDVEDLGAACSNGQRPHQPTRPRMFNRSSSKTATVNSACLTLRTYLALAQRQSKFQLRIFGGSIFLALALTISSAWQPKSWIQPIWTILGVAAGAMGATMLYVGFVWGRWEQNLLMEVVEQMELELRVSAMEDKALN